MSLMTAGWFPLVFRLTLSDHTASSNDWVSPWLSSHPDTVHFQLDDRPFPWLSLHFLCLLHFIIITVPLVSEHSQKNDAWWPILGQLWERLPEEKAKGLLPQVHFVPWISLGCFFIPPVLHIHIQLVRHVHSGWMLEHSYRAQSGQCTLNLDMAFCFSFMLCQIQSIQHVEGNCI